MDVTYCPRGGLQITTGEWIRYIYPGDMIGAREALGEGADAWTAHWTPEQVAAMSPPPPPSAVPQVISRFQARAALLQAGLLDAVTAQIEASPDPMARLAWAEAVEFKRSSPLLNGLADALGLTSEQVDDLFRQGARIEV